MAKSSLKVGNRVRVLQVPPSVEKQMPEATRQIFLRCVGRILRVDSFDDYGHLELNVMADGSQWEEAGTKADGDFHRIWIEPEFVEIVG